MAQRAFRHALLAFALGAGVIAAPATAQRYSEGYEFLQAVKKRDGDSATKALNVPGSQVVNARDISSGETALHLVVKRRDVTWVKFLLQRGANPNIADKAGITPLQLAANLGFVDGIDALTEKGARVDVASNTGETPLIGAVHRRDASLVRILLEKGADPDRADNSGRTARDYAKLISGSNAVVAEFERADAERAGIASGKVYGPSL